MSEILVFNWWQIGDNWCFIYSFQRNLRNLREIFSLVIIHVCFRHFEKDAAKLLLFFDINK